MYYFVGPCHVKKCEHNNIKTSIFNINTIFKWSHNGLTLPSNSIRIRLVAPSLRKQEHGIGHDSHASHICGEESHKRRTKRKIVQPLTVTSLQSNATTVLIFYSKGQVAV